jgi:hypothetical protein
MKLALLMVIVLLGSNAFARSETQIGCNTKDGSLVAVFNFSQESYRDNLKVRLHTFLRVKDGYQQVILGRSVLNERLVAKLMPDGTIIEPADLIYYVGDTSIPHAKAKYQINVDFALQNCKITKL